MTARHLTQRARLLATLVTLAVATSLAAVSSAAAADQPNLAFFIDSVTAGGKERPISVYASGAIDGEGAFSERSLGGDIHRVTLRFPRGTVTLTLRETLTWEPDLVGCVARAGGHSTWKITGGTGAYRGATGSGTYRDYGVLLGRRDPRGRCLGEKAMPTYVHVGAEFVGTLRL